ncbi:MAG TPA: BlaI/MecI/CopY family transcriptional regulator [Thermoanaerobaculia bacterium]
MARPRISEGELDVMRAIWSLGREAAVGEIHEAMQQGGSELAFTTVQTMLQRLADKGQVRRRLVGRAYHYAPAVKEPAAARDALRKVVDRFFGGSAAELAAHLVEDELSDSDVRRIESLLAQRGKGKR